MIRPGYNYHPADEGAFLAHCLEVRPSALVVMNAATFASQLADLLKETLVIYRAWPDGTPAEVGAASRRVQFMAEACPNPRVLLYTNNEPHRDDRVAWAQWTIQAIQEANRLGRRLCVCNWSLGTPEPEDWKGALRPVLEAMQGTPHVLGLHEYRAISWGVDNVPWLVGRYRFLVEACQHMGLDCPPVVITETGLDGLAAADKGWRSTGLSEDAYADAIEAMAQQWTGPVMGYCIFCWGNSGGWDAFRVDNALTFQARMVALAQKTPGPVPPTPEPAPPVDDPRWTIVDYYLRQLGTWCGEFAEAIRVGRLPEGRD